MESDGLGSASHAHCYAFGPYLVDLKRRLLWRDRSVIPLKSKTFEVLAVLVENRAHVVGKDEFFKLVWSDAVVQESNLVQQISMLRRALGQRPDQHEYIVTIPGRGYQFVAEAVEVPCLPAGLPTGIDIASTDVPTVARIDEEAAESAAGAMEPSGEQPVPRSSPAVEPAPLSPAALGQILGRHSTALIGTVAVVAVLIVTALAFWNSRIQETPRQRELRQFTFESGLAREPTWSPDGKRIAYTVDRAGRTDIWVQAVGEAEPVRVTSSPSQDSQPDWSPDGTRLVFRSERAGGGLYIVSSSGGEPARIADFGARPRWSPDGTLILFSSSTVRTGARGLYVVPPSGGPPRPVRSDLVEEFIATSSFASVTAAWYPEGRRVSIWGQHPKTGWTMVTASIDGGPAASSLLSDAVSGQLSTAGLRLGSFVWAPSRRYLYFEGRSQESRSVWRVTVDPDTLKWIHGPERLTTNANEDRDIAISPDGTRLAISVRSSQTRLWALPFQTSGGTLAGLGEPVTSGGTDELDADVPPDGSQLVYRAIRAGRQELRSFSIDSGQDRLLIADTTSNRSSPRWSRDGKLLAYAVTRQVSASTKAQSAVAVLSAEGGAERLLTVPGQVHFVPMDWSGDGTVMLGSCRLGDARQLGTCLFSMSNTEAPGRQLRQIASDQAFNLFCQRFSPDQHWISFLALGRQDVSQSKIYVVPASGGDWVAMTDTGPYVDKPRWAPDGRTLYYISDRGGFLNVWGRKFDTTLGRPVGDAFRVTSFASEERMIPARFGQMEMAVASNQLFLPITETSGRIWILDHVDK